MIGRRGDILWEKPTFLGKGGKRDYDCYQGWQVILPIYPVTLIHTFGWQYDSRTAKAIPLRDDPGFARRAVIRDWSGVLAVLAGIAILPVMCSGVSIVLTVVTLAVLVLAIVGFVATSSGSRDRDIRLVLGRHAWGSSDPATWDEDLQARIVDPNEKLGVESFSQLAEDFIGKGKWTEAMWAARLCVAAEDATMGEKLTDEILGHPKVIERLKHLRRHPEEQTDTFGKTPPLSRWVNGNLKEVVFEVSG
jgi:hypothetical protein